MNRRDLIIAGLLVLGTYGVGPKIAEAGRDGGSGGSDGGSGGSGASGPSSPDPGPGPDGDTDSGTGGQEGWPYPERNKL